MQLGLLSMTSLFLLDHRLEKSILHVDGLGMEHAHVLRKR
jgi:hypothetical protein